MADNEPTAVSRPNGGEAPSSLESFLRGLGPLVSSGDPPDELVESILELGRRAAGAEVAAVGRGRGGRLTITHAAAADARSRVGEPFDPPCGFGTTTSPDAMAAAAAEGDAVPPPPDAAAEPATAAAAADAAPPADRAADFPACPAARDADPPCCMTRPLVIDGHRWGIVGLWSSAALAVSRAEGSVLVEAIAAGLVAQLARARQQVLFREVESTAGIGAWSYRIEDARLWWSDEVFRIHGLEPGSAQPGVDRAIDYYHPDDRGTIRTMLEVATLQGEPWDVQLRLVTAAGETRWVRARGQRIVEGGVPTRLVGTFEDVHAGVQDELERERMRARLEHAVHGTDDGLWDWPDMEREDQWWSPRLLALLGLEPGDVPPRHASLLERVHPEDREGFEAAIERRRTHGGPLEAEVRLETADRGWRWFLARARVTGGGPGRPLRMAGAFLDVDERRRMEAELRDRTREVEAFLHAASHDLKSPMLTLDAFAARIEEAPEDAPRADLVHAAGRIRSATARMRAIVRDLLAYGRGTRVAPRMRRLPVAALLADLRSQLAADLGREGVHLETELAVPQIMADREQAMSLLQNLIVNAIEHGAADDGTVHVTLATRDAGAGRVRLEVRDHGRGVPEAERGRIFEPFERMRRPGGIGGGTGLGLAIVAKVAEAWGGRAWVEAPADDGPGAAFVVEWPGAIAAPAAPATPGA